MDKAVSAFSYFENTLACFIRINQWLTNFRNDCLQ